MKISCNKYEDRNNCKYNGYKCSSCMYLCIEDFEESAKIIKNETHEIVEIHNYLIEPSLFDDFWSGIKWDGFDPVGVNWKISENDLRFIIKKIMEMKHIKYPIKDGWHMSYKIKMSRYLTDDDCYGGKFEGLLVTYTNAIYN